MTDGLEKLLPWLVGVALVCCVFLIASIVTLIDQNGYEAGWKDRGIIAAQECAQMPPFEQGWDERRPNG